MTFRRYQVVSRVERYPELWAEQIHGRYFRRKSDEKAIAQLQASEWHLHATLLFNKILGAGHWLEIQKVR